MPGILSDSAIFDAIGDNSIRITPFDRAQLNPTSYDLTLGDEVSVYKRWVAYDANYDVRPKFGISVADVTGKPRDGGDMHGLREAVLDVREEPETVTFKIDPERGWILRPDIGYLMHTRERIWTKKYVPIVDGKSSIGRLFVQIHVTAGYGDPNFDGQYTLEVLVRHPIRVFAGMRIGQIRFHTIEGSVEKPYDGNYTGQNAVGPVASKAFRQFKA
jgi:dCTP deaminase